MAKTKLVKKSEVVVTPIVDNKVTPVTPADNEIKEIVQTKAPEPVTPQPKKREKTVKHKKVQKTKKAIAKTKKSHKRVAKKKNVPKKLETSIKLSDEKRPRYFKLTFEGVPRGRFSGHKPKQAANKALTAIAKAKEKEAVGQGIGHEFQFSLTECTRWNRKKYKREYDETHEADGTTKIKRKIKECWYKGTRNYLDKQVPVDHVQNEVKEGILKAGKVTKEDRLENGDTKYHITLLEKNIQQFIIPRDDKPIKKTVKKDPNAEKNIIVNNC